MTALRRLSFTCFSASALVALGTAALLVQLVSRNDFASLTNWFVPDGITLASTFYDFWFGVPAEVDYLASAGVNFVYAQALVAGVVGFAVTNILVLLFAARTFPVAVQLRHVLMPLPYLLLAIALPSKDVLSVALFMLFFSLMARERLFVAAVVGAGTFLIRDGASVMLLSTLVAWLVVRKRPRLAVAASVGVLGFAIIVSTAAESLFSDLFIFARQLTALEGIAESRLGLYEQGGAALRLVGNLTNLAFRPAVLDAHGGVALIGVAYWICGIALLYAFAAAAAFVWHRRSDMEVMAGLLFFVSLGVLVVSPWIQPRYLFPAAAVVLLVHRHTRLAFTPATAWVTCTLAAIAGAVLYGASPVGLPSAVDVARWSPFWLF